MKENKSKIIITILLVLVVILSTLCVLFATDIIGKDSCELNNNESINEVVDNNTEEKEEDKIEDNEELSEEDYYLIRFSENMEEISYEGLKIKINSSKKGTDSTFTINIKYGDTNLDTSFLNKSSKLTLPTEAIEFLRLKVYKIEDVYVIASINDGKQCYTTDVMIFNTDAKVLKTYYDTYLSVEDNIIHIEKSKNDHCMIVEEDTDLINYYFEVDGTQLIEK